MDKSRFPESLEVCEDTKWPITFKEITRDGNGYLNLSGSEQKQHIFSGAELKKPENSDSDMAIFPTENLSIAKGGKGVCENSTRVSSSTTSSLNVSSYLKKYIPPETETALSESPCKHDASIFGIDMAMHPKRQISSIKETRGNAPAKTCTVVSGTCASHPAKPERKAHSHKSLPGCGCIYTQWSPYNEYLCPGSYARRSVIQDTRDHAERKRRIPELENANLEPQKRQSLEADEFREYLSEPVDFSKNNNNAAFDAI